MKFKFNALQVALPDAIRDMPLKFVKRASGHCYRFMSAYRAGLPAGPVMDYAMKKYTGHRRVPEIIVSEISEEYAAKKAKKN